jgi:hypothetical protein
MEAQCSSEAIKPKDIAKRYMESIGRLFYAENSVRANADARVLPLSRMLKSLFLNGERMRKRLLDKIYQKFRAC